MIITYQGKTPSVDPTAFIAPNATLIGDVTIGPDASVWFGAVLRGDNEPIVVGRGSNVQDNATLHCDPGHPLTIGEDVTIGHNAVVHGCTVGNGVLVGMGAVVLDEAVLGDWSIVGAGAVVTGRTQVAAYSLMLGTPAKAVKTDQLGQKETNLANARGYVARKNAYMAGQ